MQNLTQTRLQIEHDNGLRPRLGKQLHSLNTIGIQCMTILPTQQVKSVAQVNIRVQTAIISCNITIEEELFTLAMPKI